LQGIKLKLSWNFINMQTDSNAVGFKQKLISGAGFTALSKYSGLVAGLVVTAILARHLSPEDYGVIAIATVFSSFFSLISDMGIATAIIQKRDLSGHDLSSIFSFTIYVGIILAASFFAVSPLIASFYKDAQLIPICQLLSIPLFFGTICSVPGGLLMRNKEFKFIAIRNILIQIFFGVVAIISVYCGAGIYALVIGPIGSSILIFIVNYRKNPLKFHYKIDFSALRKIASFSSFQFGFSLINYFTRNLDSIFIGRFIGMHSLGFYEKSYRLMLMPLQNLNGVIMPVLHPIMADYQDNLQNQCRQFLKLTKILSIIGYPFTPLMFFCASDLITIIYGNQWEPAIPVFQILSLTIYLQVIGTLNGPIMQSTNNTRKLFFTGNINTLINVSGLCVGIFLFQSITGVAWMLVVTFHIGIWNYIYIMRKVFHSKASTFFVNIMPAVKETLLCTAVLFLVSAIFDYLMPDPNIIYMILSCAVKAALTAVIVLYSLQAQNIFHIKTLLAKFRKK